MNLDKRKVMFNTQIMPEPIIVDGVPLEVDTEYVFLGQTIQLGRNNFEREADRIIQLSRAAIRKLRHVFLLLVPESLKTKVFDQCDLPVMTYGAEMWTLTVA